MPAPEINAGALDKRVTLLAPEYATEFQDEISGWTPVTDVWAAVIPTIAVEVNEAGRTIGKAVVTVVIRFRTDLDGRWRIQDRNHRYEIKGIVDVARRGVQLQLNCEEIA